MFTGKVMIHRSLATLVRDAESAEIEYLYVCREMTANKKFAASGKMTTINSHGRCVCGEKVEEKASELFGRLD